MSENGGRGVVEFLRGLKWQMVELNAELDFRYKDANFHLFLVLKWDDVVENNNE
jgi:hypothetical protein